MSDVYVKALRWASDRIGDEGIIAFVTNNSFVNDISFNGMRRHLEKDFYSIHILDLGGNVRKNPKLSGSIHNVFRTKVGVSINLLVKKGNQAQERAKIYYARLDEFWKMEQKYEFLEENSHAGKVDWKELEPDENHTWLTIGLQKDFQAFLPLGTKEAKAGKGNAIFYNYGRGVATCRDTWMYNFDSAVLSQNLNKTIEVYNEHVYKLSKLPTKPNIDDFVISDSTKISWSEGLKNYLRRQISIDYDASLLRHSMYRPFTNMWLYFNKYLNERRYQMPLFLPTPETEVKNRVLCVKGIGINTPFYALMVSIRDCRKSPLSSVTKGEC